MLVYPSTSLTLNNSKNKTKAQDKKGWEEPCWPSPDVYHIGHQVTSPGCNWQMGFQQPAASIVHHEIPAGYHPLINQAAESKKRCLLVVSEEKIHLMKAFLPTTA